MFKCSKTDDECSMIIYNTWSIRNSMLSANVLFVYFYSVLLDVIKLYWTLIVYYMWLTELQQNIPRVEKLSQTITTIQQALKLISK